MAHQIVTPWRWWLFSVINDVGGEDDQLRLFCLLVVGSTSQLHMTLVREEYIVSKGGVLGEFL